MRSLALAAVALVALGCSKEYSPPPLDMTVLPFDPAGGPLISLGNGTAFEAESSIATDGKGTVVATWIAIFSRAHFELAFAVSRDDGASWGQPVLVKSPNLPYSADPVIVADREGKFHLTWIGYRGGGELHVFYASVDPVAGTASPPVDLSRGVANPMVDKPWVVIDASDRLLLTWGDLQNNRIVMDRSLDHGASFLMSTVWDFSFVNLASGCVDPASAATPIYVVMNGEPGLWLRRSLDGGATFDAVSTAALANDAVFEPSYCAVSGKNIWLAYLSGTDPVTSAITRAGTAVWMLRSTDDAVSFEPPASITKFEVDRRFLLPQLVRSSSGALEAYYYTSVGTGRASFARARSNDNGVTFSERVLTGSGTLEQDRGTDTWLGDYFGVTATAQATYVVYADNTQGESHVRFLKVTP